MVENLLNQCSLLSTTLKLVKLKRITSHRFVVKSYYGLYVYQAFRKLKVVSVSVYFIVLVFLLNEMLY